MENEKNDSKDLIVEEVEFKRLSPTSSPSVIPTISDKEILRNYMNLNFMPAKTKNDDKDFLRSGPSNNLNPVVEVEVPVFSEYRPRR